MQMLQHIASALQKLAATRDIAIVVLTQCSTRMDGERGASLISAINASAWEQAMSTRLVLFQDWVRHGQDWLGMRFVGLQKRHGRGVGGSVESICAFKIEPVSVCLLLDMFRGTAKVAY
jgi:hypothetical protein